MITTAKNAVPTREKIRQSSRPIVWELAPIFSSVLLAVGLYLSAIEHIHLRQMTDIGLISVLPWQIYVSLLFLCVSFIFTLKQKTLREPILFLHVCLLIIMLYGITLPVEESPRFNVTC